MRSKNLAPTWVRGLNLHGFEPDPPKKEEEDEDEEDEDEDEENDPEKSKKDDKDSGEKNIEGLKSALRKERKERKKFEKELRKLTEAKEKADSKEADDLDKTKEDLAATKEKTSKLAGALLRRAVDVEIMKLASTLNFTDVDDALSLVDRDDIDAEQDEDDPSDVEVDVSTVKEALEALAKKKPHLLKAEDSSDDKSGSRFGGSRGSREKKDKDAEKQLDEERYPALRGRG